MSTTTTTCLRCGAAILTDTAERTGGLCRPCERGWRHQRPRGPSPFPDCSEGVLAFLADASGTEEDEDVISTGVSQRDQPHYVLLSRSLPIDGDEDDGVYVEVDDQINSGSNLIQRCSLSRSHLEILFRTPIDPGHQVRAVSVTLALTDPAFRSLRGALLKVFGGRENLLAISSGA